MDFKIFTLIILIIFPLYYLKKRILKFNFLDFLIISSVFSFCVNPVFAIIRGNYNFDNEIFLISISLIFFTLLFLRFLFNLFPIKFSKCISLKYIIDVTIRLQQKIIIVLFLISTATVLYFLNKYNFMFRVSNEEQANDVNFYYQTIYLIVFPLNYIVSFSIVAKYFSGQKKLLYINIIFIIIISLYWMFYGRRELFFHLLIILIIWLYFNPKKGLSIKGLILLPTFIFIMLIVSNIYQNLRFQIMTYSITREFKPNKSLVDMAFDFKSTDQNLNERSSCLPFLGTVIKKVEENHVSTSGDIFLQSIENILPAILIPSKKYMNDDEITAVGLRLPHNDYSNSLYSGFYSDFGYLSFFIIPFFYFIYFIFSSMLIFYTKRNTVINMIMFFSILTCTLNVESTITSIFYSMRFSLIIFIFYLLLKNIFPSSFLIKNKK